MAKGSQSNDRVLGAPLMAFAFPSIVVVPLLVVGVVGLFLLPVPRIALDVLLGLNLVLSLSILLRALLLREGRQLVAFPVLLLLATLYRLALNISSTRLILLYGDQGPHVAGDVIRSFGSFVVGGDFVVGAILFAVIAVVNFLVITRGAARVAEVSARFALDALPGRQLSIDAEQRQGALSSFQARERREELGRESQFFGAMDGAMRFVQGDAIATLVIVVLNAVGGVFLGIQRGLAFDVALENFGILAIGDGLVSILPALLLSVSSGIIVTHVAARSTDVRTIGQHIGAVFSEPRALLLAGCVFLAISVVPQLPFLPFFLVGALLLFASHRLARVGARAMLRESSRASLAQNFLDASLLESFREILLGSEGWGRPDVETPAVGHSTVKVEYSDDVARLLRASEGSFEFQLEQIQEQYIALTGLPFPSVVMRTAPELVNFDYRIIVRGRAERTGSLQPKRLFVEVGASTMLALGVRDVSPASILGQRPGCWLPDDRSVRDTCRLLGQKFYDVAGMLALESVAAVLDRVDDFFGVEETRRAIETLRQTAPHIVAEVIDSRVISMPELAHALRRLLLEGVSIADLKLILEGIATFSCRVAPTTERASWLEELHSALRSALARSILSDAAQGATSLKAFVLSPELEEQFREAVSVWEGPPQLPPLEPEVADAFRLNSQRMFAPVVQRGNLPVVVLCASDIRAGVHAALQQHNFGGRWFTTVAFEELGVRSQTETIGVVSLD